MTGSTGPLGPVFRLVYRSRARPGGDPSADVDAIFGVARWKNAALDVTGALLVWRDAFVQVLEGDEAVVRSLFATIRADPRHGQVDLLDADTVPDRVFARWWMARVGDDEGDDIALPTTPGGHRPAPVASPASAALHDDPRRTTMLDLMRDYARAGAGAG